jgi:hypothetical protein
MWPSAAREAEHEEAARADARVDAPGDLHHGDDTEGLWECREARVEGAEAASGRRLEHPWQQEESTHQAGEADHLHGVGRREELVLEQAHVDRRT